MPKITIMVGVSASGKSTKAKEIAHSTNAIIINRDKLREMLFGYTENNINDYYRLSDLYLKENQITSFQNYLIERALVKNNDVIIDNTNLKQRYINDFLKTFNKYTIEFCVMECDLQEAINRDKKRTRSVGCKVIKEQYQNFNILKKNFDFNIYIPNETTIINNRSKEPVYIFDIDGTLALMQNRSPYDYSKVNEDLLNKPVAEALYSLSTKYKIIICSGREANTECRKATEIWLKDNSIQYTDLIMRKEGDKRSDYVVKEEMWNKICNNYYVMAMFDDRNQVVNHARKLGFQVFQVSDCNF